MLIPIAESESRETGIKLWILEKGGLTIGKMLQRFFHKNNSVYKYECNLDGHEYIGETSRNFFSIVNSTFVFQRLKVNKKWFSVKVCIMS